MPDYSGSSPRHRPRKRSRSPSFSGDEYRKDTSSRRHGSRSSYRKEDRRGSRGYPERPSQHRRHRSRSPEDDDRRRIKREISDDSISAASKRRRHSNERHHHRDRYRSDSRSPVPKSRRHDSHDRDRERHRDRDRGEKLSQRNIPTESLDFAPAKRSKGPLPSQQAAFTKTSSDPADDGAVIKSDNQTPSKQKPNYAPSGLLAAETNTVANTSIVLKYNEPPESRLPPPSQPWRLYVFKNKDLLETIPLHNRTCWLFGREKTVCDVPVEHPSASKQHAVLQFRYVEKVVGEFGEKKGKVGLYVLDLESANGTKVNGEAVPARRFLECRNGDVIQFGESVREYVILLPPKE